MKDVVVLGGGISGLSFAWFLARASPQTRIRIVEAKHKLGGWVDTCRSSGFLFENGPRGFRPSRNGAEMLRLVQELQLENQMVGTNEAAKARFIMRNGVVEQIPPSSALELLRWPMTPVFAHGILRDVFVARRSNKDDESIHEFVSRRFNSTIADRVVDPVVSGIFAGNVHELSVRSCMKDLYELDQSHGSVVRGAIARMMASSQEKAKSSLLLDGTPKSEFIRRSEKSMSVSFHDGMSTVINALGRQFEQQPHSEIHLNRKAIDIRKSSDGKTVKIHTVDARTGQDEQVLSADTVVSMIPAHQLAQVVQSQSQQLTQVLQTIQFASMATVHVGFHQDVLSKNGFGYLVPSCEHQKILGCVFDSTSFPSQNENSKKPQTRLSVMLGGSNQPWVQQTDASELQEIALQQLEHHMAIDAKPDFINTVKLHNSIPLYHVGFWKTLHQIEHEMARVLPQVQFAGNSFYGVGTSDCVHRAKAMALEFAKQDRRG